MEGDAIASTVRAFGAIERQSTGTAFEIQTQYIRTGSTCQLRQYEKCCSFLFVLGHFRILHKGHSEVLRRCALRQQLRHDHKPLIAAVGLVVLPAAGGERQEGVLLEKVTPSISSQFFFSTVWKNSVSLLPMGWGSI